MARPAEAAPFVCVANDGAFANSVSVIDTASNAVVATVTVGANTDGVAATPDGKHDFVANSAPGTVSVIRMAKQKVVATVAVGTNPFGVGIMP